ncbi:hypothetical protein PHYC_03518 [Phycisphaerales bacterium]|nr:hypothetical protein PHYC_03518 [Phycisphaerales bacterium]
MSRRTRQHRLRRAATLVELIVSITVIAVVAGVSLPVIHGATDAYASAAEIRRAAERGAYAMEKTVRLLRDAPEGAAPGTLGLSKAAASEVIFSDGRGLRLDGTTLRYVQPDGSEPVLCEDVEEFTVTYLAKDGATSMISTPQDTQRFHVTLKVRGFELRTCVMARLRMISG